MANLCTTTVRISSSLFLFLALVLSLAVSFPADTHFNLVEDASVSSFEDDAELERQYDAAEQHPDGRMMPTTRPFAADPTIDSNCGMVQLKEARIVSDPVGASTIRKQHPVVPVAGSDAVVFTHRTTTSATSAYPPRIATQTNRLPVKSDFTTPPKVWWNPQDQTSFAPTPVSTSSSTPTSRPTTNANTTGADSNTTDVIDFKEIINAPNYTCPKKHQKRNHMGDCVEVINL